MAELLGPPTEEEVEELAREMCRVRGENPDHVGFRTKHENGGDVCFYAVGWEAKKEEAEQFLCNLRAAENLRRRREAGG